MKIVLVANTSWYLYNFRRNLIRALQEEGHQVLSLGDAGEYGDKLRNEGFAHKEVGFTQAGTSPLREWRTVQRIRREFRAFDADVALSWTPKGNSYAALAARGLQVKRIANVSGLGRAFIHKTWVTRVARVLLKFALGGASTVFFQNRDDRELLVQTGIAPGARARLLPGSGVDLTRFAVTPLRPDDGTRRVLMVSRLLWSKGAAEFAAAAQTLRREDEAWRFQLLGAFDDSPSSGVPRTTLQQWVDDGRLEYLGTTDDVRLAIAASDCVVLPSYREGLPRTMLEAAAMARPILTTDAPGCRDCVREDRNGFLFAPRDADSLANALRRFASLTTEQRAAMGQAGRKLVEESFDERIVIEAYRQAIRDIAGTT